MIVLYYEWKKDVVPLDRLHDEGLVALCLEGKREAFEELVKRYQRQIFSLAFRMTRNYEDAGDLTQEVFMHLFRVLNKFDGKRKFFPWMYRIATNVCYNALKKKPKDSYPLDNVIDFTPRVPDRNSQPEDYSETREIQQVVHTAIADLPENYRVPIILKYLEDMSYKEIAEVMDLPITTIETRLYRGRIMLEERLEKLRERGPKDGLSRSQKNAF